MQSTGAMTWAKMWVHTAYLLFMESARQGLWSQPQKHDNSQWEYLLGRLSIPAHISLPGVLSQPQCQPGPVSIAILHLWTLVFILGDNIRQWFWNLHINISPFCGESFERHFTSWSVGPVLAVPYSSIMEWKQYMIKQYTSLRTFWISSMIVWEQVWWDITYLLSDQSQVSAWSLVGGICIEWINWDSQANEWTAGSWVENT
jgi:hypothetical protein